LAKGGAVSDPIPGKSDTELAIESFVDSIKEIHPKLDRQELHDTIRGYVREHVEDSREEEKGLADKIKDKLPGQ
jgi:predicted metal-dependent hydrolase